MSYEPFSQRAKRARLAARNRTSVPDHRPSAQQLENAGAIARRDNPRLVECAIRADGYLHRGFRSHYELRRSMGRADPMHGLPGDEEGFADSNGEFLSRDQARYVAIAAGQVSSQWSEIRRPLLSSDLRW